MNWVTAFAVAALCVVMATAEGMLTSRSFVAWLGSLKHPRWYAPMSVWVVAAFVIYAIQGVIAYRLIEWSDPVLGKISLLLLVIVMSANVAYNVVLDRTRNLASGYRGLLWFAFVLGLLQLSLFLSDPVSAALNLVYVAWVVLYDVPLMRALVRLNA